MKKNRYTEVKIENFSKKGNGIGNDLEGREIEVPFTIPGDRAKVLLLGKRGGIRRSLLEEVLEASGDRISPKCIHFGKCGGCRWQQISYSKQLEIKTELVKKWIGDNIHPIIPCEEKWNYRNKMEYSFSEDLDGNHYLGLIMDSSRGKVLNLSECHLPNPWFVETLKNVKAWWKKSGLKAYKFRKNTGSLRTLTMREGMRTGERMVILTVSGNPDFALNQDQIKSFVSCIGDITSIFLQIQQIHKGSPTQFFEMHLYGKEHIREILNVNDQSYEFFISPSAFFQPNTHQAEKLYFRAIELLEANENDVVYDLYCGTGTLGICIAKKVKQVIGIEISPEAILDARMNAEKNGIDNVEFLSGSVHEKLKKMDGKYPKPDIVMVDPPRSGLDPITIQLLKDLNPKKILYISCNPKTQGENIRELNMKIEAIQPIDQFPHTIHIENIVILSNL